jgi:hypothetical protein
MPRTKIWVGTTTDLTLVTNWEQENIRDAAHTWSASGSGTNEFYVEYAGNTDPEIVAAPPSVGGVYINGVAATKGTLGSLAAGEWDYGDNDTLGHDTIYVRLADGTNPNTKAAGYVKFNQIPQTAEHVNIPEGSGAISSNVDFSGVAIGKFTVARSNDNRAMGSATNPIRLVCSGFVFEGGGQTSAYFDLTNSVIAPEIRSTASVDVDEFGLYLAAAAVTVADLRGGSIGLGMLPDLPFVCSTGARVRGSSARVGIGSGSTVPLLEVLSGTVEHENSIANIEVDGGVVRSLLAAAVSGAVEVRGGTWYDQSTGTKAAVTANGGNLDATQGGAKTWSAFTPNSGTLRDDPDTLTITTVNRPTASGSFTWLKP